MLVTCPQEQLHKFSDQPTITEAELYTFNDIITVTFSIRQQGNAKLHEWLHSLEREYQIHVSLVKALASALQ